MSCSLTIGTGTDLINDGGIQIEEDSAKNVLSSSSFGEESVECVIFDTNGFVGWHLAIRLNSVL
jgi:hypothetical protein